MDTTNIDLENLTQDDFLEMAKYVAYLENQNQKILEELRESKSALMATVQQRNSYYQRLQQLMNEKANTINITPSTTKSEIVTNIELVNPEVWAVPSGKVITTPKTNKI